MAERHEVVLTGCNPTPLAGYLKGLGVLSLIADQIDHQATARWSGNTFILRSILDRSKLHDFFLCKYMPTPIISPWSGRAGFLEGEAGSDSTRKGAIVVRQIIKSTGDRFKSYRTTINAAEDNKIVSNLNNARTEVKNKEQELKEHRNKGRQVTEEDQENLKELKKREKNLKNLLLLSLRAELDESFLLWFDSCVALAGNESLMAPLLGGSGGNEGSMDFSINHLEHLMQLIDPATDEPTEVSKSSINHALFDRTTVVPSRTQGNPGFFSPGVTGGPNMSNGYFKKNSRQNPWNTILMLEGAILFASTITKRVNSSEEKFLSFPFIFEAFQAGDGSIYAKEKNRPEFWAPLWNQFATITELRSLISEGRCTVRRKTANDGLDMLRAVKSLGVDRSIKAFQRYGFFERRGKEYYAAMPIGRFSVEHNEVNPLVEDLYHNNWLSKFHKFTNGGEVADRFVGLRRRLDEQLFLIASRNSYPVSVQQTLTLLGEIQTELAHSTKARGSIHPIPQLSERWVPAADDKSTVFRIACALAGLRGIDTNPLPLRSQLFPIHHTNRNDWLEKARKDTKLKDDPACRIRLHVFAQGDLTELLITLLQRRLSLPARLDFKDKPLNSIAGVDLADLSAFLIGEYNGMDSSIAALLPGLSLCKIPDSDVRKAGEAEIHAAYALCKLALTPNATLRGLGLLGKEQSLPGAPHLVSKLATGNPDQVKQAIEIAWRRLRGSGLDPVMPFGQLPHLAGIDARRLAAALLIPLNFGATGALAKAVLKNDDLIETEPN